ncbi:hypothetical protein ROHU_024409 [Labeo rohita]|uniref:Uncharacterized protein n=1 Tax=Labeo rohita TaxID=84645 RepID=A0A498MNN7_LABRO|nr:hypothetical protein ROHU_024409 [Labeo rohita]
MGWQYGDCHLPAALYDVRRTRTLLMFPPIKGRGPTFLTRMGFEDKHWAFQTGFPFRRPLKDTRFWAVARVIAESEKLLDGQDSHLGLRKHVWLTGSAWSFTTLEISLQATVSVASPYPVRRSMKSACQTH